MKGGLEMKVQGSKTSKAAPAAEYKGEQKGSLLLEAIVVLGMIATFTPMLYKHVADRRADIENINRANTLLYLQHKAEDYLKDPDNITALVEELGHNQHKEIYPSEMGAGDNFDGRYIVGIRREDEENKPVLKAMIIDTVHTGSDLRAAKVAELIGISAGIYTAVDPDAAWGINGIWSEPLSRYFDTTNIPTGAVAITTEYNKAKYRVNISDILVDADLDMGEFEVTAEQINAVAIAAQNGTLDQLIAQDVRASNKVVAGKKLCVGGEEDENCIESWEGLGGKDDSDLRLVQECNAGMTESCMGAFARDLNTSCSKVDEVYDRFGAAYPSPKIYGLSYGNGTEYVGSIRTKCEGTQFVVSDISTATLTNPVEMVGGSAFAITQPGWYQITLMGEAGYWGGYTATHGGAGGILTANKQFSKDEILTIKGIKGGWNGQLWGGAGVALWDIISTTGVPTLVAGGGRGSGFGGGGIVGGSSGDSANSNPGYGWNGTLGGNTATCNAVSCGFTKADGGSLIDASHYGGSGSTQSACSAAGYSNCTTIMGGNAKTSGASPNYSCSTYGNWGTNTLTGGKGYASIRWCGPSGSASTCPDTCSTDSDCPTATPFCNNGFCSESCTSDSQCQVGQVCTSGECQAQTCLIANDCPSSAPYCNNGECSTTQILTCDSTSTMATATWVAGWANCTSCPAGQFKKYKSGGELGENGCTYPVAHTGGCINIPPLNSYTTLPTGSYVLTNSWATASNVNMWHRQVNITCNGKNEEWDLIGPFLEWWEAQEVCAKLGKSLPVNAAALTGGCSEGARWSLIKNATAVGTGQTLTAVSGISNTTSWNSSTGNTTSSKHWIWTQQDWGNSCWVWTVLLVAGEAYNGSRHQAHSYRHALCGPAN